MDLYSDIMKAPPLLALRGMLGVGTQEQQELRGGAVRWALSTCCLST